MTRILWLEDETWQVEGTVIAYLEKKLGYQVTLCSSVREAGGQLSKNFYDLIILDCMLGTDTRTTRIESTGFVLLEQLRRGEFQITGNPASTPVIVATGVYDVPLKNSNGEIVIVEEYAHSMGVPEQQILRKPFLTSEVDEAVEFALGHTANADED